MYVYICVNMSQRIIPGATLVYIISYPIGGDEQGRVEKFKWNTTDKTLTHMRSISDPQIRS